MSTYELMVCLANEYPGQAVCLVKQAGCIEVGVLNILPGEDDWFWTPVPVLELDLDSKGEDAKINSIAESAIMAP